MGKLGRFACIFTPMALTIASFVCQIFVELGGHSGLQNMQFFSADLSNLTIPASSSNALLTLAVNQAKAGLAKNYEVYLWNYCSSNHSDHSDLVCSDRKAEFVFDPVQVWGFQIANSTAAAAASSTTSSPASIASILAHATNETKSYENQLLGDSGRQALDAYRTAAKWQFIAYQVSLWTTLATIVVGILALFSRWGSFLTWLFSISSSLFSVGAALTSTILFSLLVSALGSALKPYGISLSLGTHALVVVWLGVAFSLLATLFWLASVCCCSGSSNPHHRSNKGGLWTAQPPSHASAYEASRGGVRVEKSRAGQSSRAPSWPASGPAYAPVHSQRYFHPADDAEHVPLQQYAAPQAGFGHHTTQQYEPFRHV